MKLEELIEKIYLENIESSRTSCTVYKINIHPFLEICEFLERSSEYVWKDSYDPYLNTTYKMVDSIFREYHYPKISSVTLGLEKHCFAKNCKWGEIDVYSINDEYIVTVSHDMSIDFIFVLSELEDIKLIDEASYGHPYIDIELTFKEGSTSVKDLTYRHEWEKVEMNDLDYDEDAYI